jgi:hypothetical protein
MSATLDGLHTHLRQPAPRTALHAGVVPGAQICVVQLEAVAR